MFDFVRWVRRAYMSRRRMPDHGVPWLRVAPHPEIQGRSHWIIHNDAANRTFALAANYYRQPNEALVPLMAYRTAYRNMLRIADHTRRNGHHDEDAHSAPPATI